jgi:hypothetical protein
MPGSEGATLPFQDLLDDDLKHKIDAREMGLVDLANAELAFSVRRLQRTSSLVEGLANLRVPVGALTPANGRRVNALYNHTDYATNTRGNLSWATCCGTR